jgi:GntR family transcriptional regulator/MocR family aminotransferase
MRAIYASRRQLLVDRLERALPGILDVAAPDSGMNLIAWLPTGSDDVQVGRALEAAGVDSLPLSAFVLERPLRPGLILGYSGIREADLDEAVARLARVLRRVVGSRAHRATGA